MSKAKFNSELFKFAVFPNYDQAITFLADTLADKEDWDFSDTVTKSNGILKNYLEFTFRKLLQEKKVRFTLDNKFACFNTGLVTENLEDIFAFFEEYKNPRPGFSTPFCFKAFLKKSDNNVLRHFSHSIPDVADFFDKPELLIFNPKCDLIPDLDHIIKDNLSRFLHIFKNLMMPNYADSLLVQLTRLRKKQGQIIKLLFHNITTAKFNYCYPCA